MLFPAQTHHELGAAQKGLFFVIGLAVSSHQHSINASKSPNWEATMLLDIGCGSKRRRRLLSATTSSFITLWWRSTTFSGSSYICAEMFSRPHKAPPTPSLFFPNLPSSTSLLVTASRKASLPRKVSIHQFEATKACEQNPHQRYRFKLPHSQRCVRSSEKIAPSHRRRSCPQKRTSTTLKEMHFQ